MILGRGRVRGPNPHDHNVFKLVVGPPPTSPKKHRFFGEGKKNTEAFSGPGLPFILTFSPAAKTPPRQREKTCRETAPRNPPGAERTAASFSPLPKIMK
jgi:hypothetical protein